MSIEVTTMVWNRLNVNGGELLLALAIADFSNKHGEGIWPSVKTLGQMSRQGERTVRRQLAYFREVKWLEVVELGGLAGGRGKTTQYRINPAWIKGAELAGFPDSVEANYADVKAAKLAGLPEKGGQLEHETLPNGAQNPATAMADNPSGSINDPKSADPGTDPSGPGAALDKNGNPFDADASFRAWFADAHGRILALAQLNGFAPRGEPLLKSAPDIAWSGRQPRDVLLDLCRELATYGVYIDRKNFPDCQPHWRAIGAEFDARISQAFAKLLQCSKAAA
jgi:hypothetical protein